MARPWSVKGFGVSIDDGAKMRGQLLVDATSMADRDDAISPLPFKLTSEWSALRGVDAQDSQGRLDAESRRQLGAELRA
jgi:hypothetical protein